MRRLVPSSTSLPSPPNTASSTDWLSLGEVRTYMPPEAPIRAAEKRTEGAGASSRSSQVTPVEFRPAIMARLRARDTRLVSRPRVTLDPFLRVEPKAVATRRTISGVRSTLPMPLTPSSPNSPRAAALPDDRLVDGRARFHRLIGIDLDVGLKDRPVADVGVVADDHAVLDPAALLDVGAAPDHAAAQAGPGPDVGVVVDDGPVQEGVALHDHARPDHGVLAQAGPGLDLGEVADEHGRGQDGVGVELGPLPSQTPGRTWKPRTSTLTLPSRMSWWARW